MSGHMQHSQLWGEGGCRVSIHRSVYLL